MKVDLYQNYDIRERHGFNLSGSHCYHKINKTLAEIYIFCCKIFKAFFFRKRSYRFFFSNFAVLKIYMYTIKTVGRFKV